MNDESRGFSKKRAESFLEDQDEVLRIDESVAPVPLLEYGARHAVEPEFYMHVLGVYGLETQEPEGWNPDADTKEAILASAKVYRAGGLEGGHVIEIPIPQKDGTIKNARFFAEEGTFEPVH